MIGLMFDDGVLVRTKRFVPDYPYTQSFLATEAIDEAVAIDVTRSTPSAKSWKAMGAFADRCFAPITMGGQIRSTGDVSRFFDLGADKVVIGSAALEDPDLVMQTAYRWGCQAAVVAVDVLNGEVVHGRTKLAAVTGKRTDPANYAASCEAVGAGEILFQSVDRDGSLGGFDLDTLERIVDRVGIPVTIGGGCGGWRHMQEAFEAGASGAVTTCIHHFPEAALRGFKERLHGAGVLVRSAA